jgi:gliding motility-associated-like protein
MVVGITTTTTQTLIDNYTLTITDNNNTCKSFSVVPIQQNIFVPTASISALNNAAITCLTPTITLSNQSKTGIPGTTGFPTNLPVIGYLWEGPTPQVPLQANSTYVAGVVGIYTLTAKDLNNGCTSVGTYSVADNRNYPNVAISTETIDCGDQFKTFSVTASGTGSTSLTYSWTSPPTTTIGNPTNKNLQVQFPGTYTVLITNTVNGCATRSTAVAFSGSLTAGFVATPDSGFAPLQVTFVNNSFSSNGTSSISASWNYGNGVTSGSTTPTGSFIPGPISNTQSPIVVYNQPGTYTVTMFATKGACLDTASKVIKVEIPSSLTIPNVFTPNGDGVNDLFFLKASNLAEITMTVFDRWGHLVYELTSKTGNIEWDGKNQEGKESAAGTYFYTLKATGTDGSAYDKKGTITLIR